MKEIEKILAGFSRKPTKRQKKVLETFFKLGEREYSGFKKASTITPITGEDTLDLLIGWGENQEATAELKIYANGSSILLLCGKPIKGKFTEYEFLRWKLKDKLALVYENLKAFFRESPAQICTECGSHYCILEDRPLVAGDYEGDQIYFYQCKNCKFKWDLSEKEQEIIRARFKKYEDEKRELFDYSDEVYAEMEKELIEIIKKHRKKLTPKIKEVNKLAAHLTDNYPMRGLHTFYDFAEEDEREPEIDGILYFFDWD